MPRQASNIFRRPDSKNWYAGFVIAGRFYRKSLQTTDRRTALERARVFRNRILAGVVNAPASSGSLRSFATNRWLPEWVSQRRKGKGLELATQRMKDHVFPAIGDIEMRKIRPPDLRKIRARIDDVLSPVSVKHVLSDVRCLFAYAVDCGLIGTSPFRRDLMPRVPEAAPKPMTDREVDRVLSAALEPEAWTIRILLETGLRWGELRSLQWRHVHEDPYQHFVLEGTKSGRVRRVPLSDLAWSLVTEEKARTSSVFVSPYRGKNAGNIPRRINGRLPEKEQVTWSIHRLRHTFACRYLARGGSLVALQRILGHSTSRMTERYAALEDGSVLDDFRRVQQHGDHAGRAGSRS